MILYDLFKKFFDDEYLFDDSNVSIEIPKMSLLRSYLYEEIKQFDSKENILKCYKIRDTFLNTAAHEKKSILPGINKKFVDFLNNYLEVTETK